MLDTNIVSDLVRNPDGAITEHIRQVGERAVATSIVVAAELRYGVAKRASSRLADLVERPLQRLEILPLASPADRHYAELRSVLERQGRPIGNNDMWIAAHALALDCTLVTANEREFARIQDLKLENWLR